MSFRFVCFVREVLRGGERILGSELSGWTGCPARRGRKADFAMVVPRREGLES